MSLTLSQVQPLTSKSTAKDIIPQKLSGYGYQAKISFAHGLANDVPLYDIEKISVNDNQLISYSLRNDTWSYSPLGEFEYRIPANFVGNIEDVKHVFRALNTSFDSVGGFTIVDHLFMQDPKSHNGPEIKSYKLVTKSGAILDLPSRKDYEFSFDQDGYLLSAKPE